MGHSSRSETQYPKSNTEQNILLNTQWHYILKNTIVCVWVRPTVLCFDPGQARPVCGSHSRCQHAEKSYLCQGRSKTDHWSFSHIRHSLPVSVKACESSSPFSKDAHVELCVKSDEQQQYHKRAGFSG